MALSDYSHHNEEATRIWWQEEGQWAHEMVDQPEENDPGDWDDDVDDFDEGLEDKIDE